MRIAVCDDEEKENINLSKLIYDFADKNGIDVDVSAFTSGKELLAQDKFDVYFLDYVMPQMNGMDIALALREKFGDSPVICFLTSYERAAVQIINNNIFAIGFLTKPIAEQELCDVLLKLQKKSLFNPIILKKERTAFIYYPQDILYAEAMRKATALVSFSSRDEFRISFADIENEYLPEKLFFKVHRSYIINMMHVVSYSRKEITMKNGDIIPVSRSVDFESAIEAFRFDDFL